MDSSTTSSGNNENHLVSNNSSSMGSSAKKRKLSMGEMSSTNIELEILRSTIEKWKQYAQKLEAEKLQHIDGCNAEKILELEETVKKLNARNAELQANNEQHQSELQSIINENTAKIKIFEGEKQEAESKIKELTDEIATMKNIKMEIKDSVENERENAQNEIQTLKAETQKLKDTNCVLEEIVVKVSLNFVLKFVPASHRSSAIFEANLIPLIADKLIDKSSMVRRQAALILCFAAFHENKEHLTKMLDLQIIPKLYNVLLETNVDENKQMILNAFKILIQHSGPEQKKQIYDDFEKIDAFKEFSKFRKHENVLIRKLAQSMFDYVPFEILETNAYLRKNFFG